ncbi:MAG: hypothetical protein RL754_128 [Bacteroidota bacterium]
MKRSFLYTALLYVAVIRLHAQTDTTAPIFEMLEEVEIRRDPGVVLSKKSVLSKELISEVELRKAACCDLSESFETNASISASFTDAVTGTRQIKLLGLEGPYALYTRGNLATMGGLNAVLGLGFIPGAWIQSIQLSKGPGSVVNGPSAISGQINYELRPSNTKKVGHLNLFAGPGRFEQNLIYSWKQGPKLSSNIMVHGRQQLFRWDNNNDGYLDAPLSKHYFIQNAWKHSGKNSEAQFGVKASTIRNIGGSTLYGYETLVPIWSHELNTNRYELWAKRGYFLKGGINRSIGTQMAATYQELDSYFGNLSFTGKEQRFYGNLIFQDNLIDTRHTLKTGLDLNSFGVAQNIWNRDASYDGLITGAYAEYSFVASPDGEGLSLIAGQRTDFLNVGPRIGHSFYHTPRLHLKYGLGAWNFRAQASKSYRIATLGAEYMGYMASSRVLVSWGDPTGGDLNVPIERATTYGFGVNWTQDVFYKELQWYADLYLNRFQDKVMFDFDQDTETLLILPYNIGTATPYALAGQVGGQYELLHRTMVKVAYRYQDVKQIDISGFAATNEIKLEEALLTVPHLVYIGASYSGRKGLGLELNATYNSSQRLPDVGYDDRSPAFTMLNMQISKEFKHSGQFYLGLQNALNVRQTDPVIGGNLPFDGRFDASVVWGPIMGRQLYAGWRLDLQKE